MLHLTQDRVVTGSRRILALGVLLALMAAMLLPVGPAHAAETFTVNSTGDDGDLTPGNGECYTGIDVAAGVKACTLRAAIEEANALSGADVIEFDIPGTDVKTITPASALPKITGPVTINGYSQPGAEPNTKAVGNDALLKIELSGASCPNCYGLVLGSSNSTVKGLVINRAGTGIRIDGSGATGNRITGNFIGTDASGTLDLGNSSYGVRVFYGSNNTIGGATPAERNVISGNGHSGVGIGDGVVTKSNIVIGNYIGTDKTGTQDLGNGYYGVNTEDAPGTTIGGTTAGARNVISANDQNGVDISSPGNKVQGNFVGTDASGTKDLGNSLHGVHVNGSPNNTVGGTQVAARNIISGNGFNGVFISGADATGNEVMGNYVGTDASGTKDLGNSFHGVRIEFDASNNTVGGTEVGARNIISANDNDGVRIASNGAAGNEVIGNYIGADKNGAAVLGNRSAGVFVGSAPNNTVGGTESGARNVISGNGEEGVRVYGDGATGNRTLSNSIFANAALGIDLVGTEGPTPNDTDDADTGPNYLQNFPELASAKTVSGKTTIRGTLNSTPNKTFRVEFFSSPEADPSGYGEGKKFLGHKSVTTDASGNVTFTYAAPTGVTAGHAVTATATGPGGNTSEFSAARKVVAQ